MCRMCHDWPCYEAFVIVNHPCAWGRKTEQWILTVSSTLSMTQVTRRFA